MAELIPQSIRPFRECNCAIDYTLDPDVVPGDTAYYESLMGRFEPNCLHPNHLMDKGLACRVLPKKGVRCYAEDLLTQREWMRKPYPSCLETIKIMHETALKGLEIANGERNWAKEYQAFLNGE